MITGRDTIAIWPQLRVLIGRVSLSGNRFPPLKHNPAERGSIRSSTKGSLVYASKSWIFEQRCVLTCTRVMLQFVAIKPRGQLAVPLLLLPSDSASVTFRENRWTVQGQRVDEPPSPSFANFHFCSISSSCEPPLVEQEFNLRNRVDGGRDEDNRGKSV